MPDRANVRLPRPKFIARALVAFAALACLPAVAPADAGARKRESRLDRTERQLIRQVNRVRWAHGLRSYRPSRVLSRSANSHSGDMLRGDFFAHSSSDGTSFESRLRRYTRAARLGENLAWVPGAKRRGSASKVVAMWMGSPSHRAAVLSPVYARIGVGRRTGRIGGARVTVITADLATRR